MKYILIFALIFVSSLCSGQDHTLDNILDFYITEQLKPSERDSINAADGAKYRWLVGKFQSYKGKRRLVDIDNAIECSESIFEEGTNVIPKETQHVRLDDGFFTRIVEFEIRR